MPIYEYECKQCGHQMEALQKMSDDLLTECPVCNKPELKKLVSAAGFRLSGKGWYETDFKSGNKKNLTSNEDNSSKPAADKKSSAPADKKASAGSDKKASSDSK